MRVLKCCTLDTGNKMASSSMSTVHPTHEPHLRRAPVAPIPAPQAKYCNCNSSHNWILLSLLIRHTRFKCRASLSDTTSGQGLPPVSCQSRGVLHSTPHTHTHTHTKTHTHTTTTTPSPHAQKHIRIRKNTHTGTVACSFAHSCPGIWTQQWRTWQL